MRLVILESPYQGKGIWPLSALRRWRNRRYARAALRHSLMLGEAPLASHLLYTQPGVLRDDVPTERRLGIEAGLAWGYRAEATVVYIDHGISGGMATGINRAHSECRKVEYRSIYPNPPPHWAMQHDIIVTVTEFQEGEAFVQGAGGGAGNVPERAK